MFLAKKKIKAHHKYCPPLFGTMFDPKFVREANVQNSTFLIYYIYIFAAIALP